MKIYVAHSKKFDYKEELYKPLMFLREKHKVVFPHENSEKMFNSKEYLKEADIMIAEVTFSGTGMGIELGWANANGVRTICLNKKGSKVSGALKAISSEFIEYSNAQELKEKTNTFLNKVA